LEPKDTFSTQITAGKGSMGQGSGVERSNGSWVTWVINLHWPMTHVGIRHTLKYPSGSQATRS